MTESVVYEHLRDSVVFYVGMGKPGREKDKKNGRSHFHRGVWNLSEDEGSFECRIVFRGTRKECEEEEKRRIKLYGKRCDDTGTLVNFTDGGDGGDTWTNNPRYDEMVEQKRHKAKELWNDPIYRENHSKSMEKASEKMSQSQLERWKDPKQHEQHRLATRKKEKYTDQELKEKFGPRVKGRHWWVNRETNCEVLNLVCPGPEWVRGRKFPKED